MNYFDYFVVASWMFAFGWFLGAIYVQNRSEKRERPRQTEKLEQSAGYETWRLPVAASASAD
jgi:hypothetical protein